jgi:hypothetical protein
VIGKSTAADHSRGLLHRLVVGIPVTCQNPDDFCDAKRGMNCNQMNETGEIYVC